jgi:hypothetical protein
MRSLFISLMFSLITFTSFSQVKILFDATKAETAGNADWVIDADVYNIYWNSSGGYSLTGSESNAQIAPTPAQSGITVSTSESYWTGGISSWGIDMVKKGYAVETLPCSGQITYGNTGNTQDLSNYKVFIVCEPNIQFTAAEKTALIQFVQNGGGLFMVGDHNDSDRNNDGMDSPHIWNDFMDTTTVHYFGIHFDYADFSQTTNNIAVLPGDPLLHGIMGNVTQVMWSGGNTLTLSPTNNSSVKGVIFKTGSSTTGTTNCMVAYATYGSGRVVAMGDSSPADDGSGDSGDVLYDGWIADASGNHEKLIVNATIWLAGTTTGIPIDNNVSDKLLIYPNPSNDIVNIQIPEFSNFENIQLAICDLSGKRVLQYDDLSLSVLTLNKSQLCRGMYFVELIVDGTITTVSKLEISE